MKLDVNALRYLSRDDFRTLTAVEMGQKNHELVPLPLIDSISGLKHGGAFRSIKTLLRHKLVHHENQKYDGYRLTYMGYDFLAIRALTARGHITGVGRQIGVGKESDIFEVMNEEGEVFALKLHRLGRTSFRAVKNKRDYLGKRNAFSWLYLSRLAALKEFAFMKALGEHGFPVPQAIDSNRHAVLMTLVAAQPLVQVKRLQRPAQVYLTCMELISRLAAKGLIHCDFNEFNLLISADEELTLIDFPQMVSVRHANAEEYFQRDVECIVRFFTKKVGYIPDNDPQLPYVRPSFGDAVAAMEEELDVDLAASGFKTAHQEVLEAAYADQEASGSGSDSDDLSPHTGCLGTVTDDEDEGEQGQPQGGQVQRGQLEGGQQGPGCVIRPGVTSSSHLTPCVMSLAAGNKNNDSDTQAAAATATAAAAADGPQKCTTQTAEAATAVTAFMSSGRHCVCSETDHDQGQGDQPRPVINSMPVDEQTAHTHETGIHGAGADGSESALPCSTAPSAAQRTSRAGSDSVGGDCDSSDSEARERRVAVERQVRREARRVAGSVAASTIASSYVPLGERELQALVVSERQKAVRKEALRRASRNSSKVAKGKGTRSVNKAGAGADFGGW